MIAGRGCVDEYVTAGDGDVRSGIPDGDARLKSVPLGRCAGGAGEMRSSAAIPASVPGLTDPRSPWGNVAGGIDPLPSGGVEIRAMAGGSTPHTFATRSSAMYDLSGAYGARATTSSPTLW